MLTCIGCKKSRDGPLWSGANTYTVRLSWQHVYCRLEHDAVSAHLTRVIAEALLCSAKLSQSKYLVVEPSYHLLIALQLTLALLQLGLEAADLILREHAQNLCDFF